MCTKFVVLAAASIWVLGGCVLEDEGSFNARDRASATGGAPLGAPCAMAMDCGSDACCYQGSCRASTSAAPGPCEQQSDCQLGTLCLAGSCETACASDSECAPGQTCDPSQQVCVGGSSSGSGGYWTTTGGTNSNGGNGSGGSSGAGSTGASSAGGSNGGSGTTGSNGTSSGGSTASSGGGSGGTTGAPVRDLSQVPVGAACQSDSDCGLNGVCQPPLDLSNGANPTRWTGGYCTAQNCDVNDPCPQGAECFVYPEGGTPQEYSLCLASCKTSACQRPGYTCSAVGDPIYACLPECQADVDCGPNLVCDSGSCASPCQADSECAAGEICSGNHCQAAPPRSCSACEPCPSGESCQNGECITSCKVDSDCPVGERCGCSGVCG